ncbi:MAG: hypothetical protein QW727_04530 [Candidatus Pacearchaeota archaeon]
MKEFIFDLTEKDACTSLYEIDTYCKNNNITYDHVIINEDKANNRLIIKIIFPDTENENKFALYG